ncbi:MAG: NADH-quinone oxidoreductase subunit C, partial [Fimbriimonadaceae bacterium]|nr:NADH-quinone oxidoreductase subunit C [Alphaproteobacteria bacterium]
MDEALKDIQDCIAENLDAEISSSSYAFGELTLEVQGEYIVRVLNFLRDDTRCGFVSFIDICGADYPAREQRFDVVYHLLSPRQNARIRIKVATDEVKPVPSVISVFPAAEWFEREAYDMYGILFSGHPDMRRMLTD